MLLNEVLFRRIRWTLLLDVENIARPESQRNRQPRNNHGPNGIQSLNFSDWKSQLSVCLRVRGHRELESGCIRLEQWFSNGGPQEVARCAANILALSILMQFSTSYLCELGSTSLTKYKCINMFLILYTKCARKFVYILRCVANQKSLRITGLESRFDCTVILFPWCWQSILTHTDKYWDNVSA
jgi:hypothetical protein